VPVIVGITDTSHKDAIRMAAKSYECGALAVVAAPPYYFQASQADLLNYFKRLAVESPLPLFLYNAPLNTHHWIEVETVIQLAAETNVAGLKDSGLKMGYFHAVRETSACWWVLTICWQKQCSWELTGVWPAVPMCGRAFLLHCTKRRLLAI
jgi:dihydrodipicolinate synthase/N-acetylneuraminate lyase